MARERKVTHLVPIVCIFSLIEAVPPAFGVDFISGDNTPAGGGVLWAVARTLGALAMSSRV